VQERRKFSREHYELRAGGLYFDGQLMLIPQRHIRSVLLDRMARGAWVPAYPAVAPVKLGDDVGVELVRTSA
jgi:hypothetical protein